MTADLDAPALTPPGQDLVVIPEQHLSHLEFNVMPGRPVSEDLHVREYRVGHRYAEAHFDRTYHSSMLASPSHLIFLSVLVHGQKLLYLALCREWRLEYDPQGPERFKMWPTKLDLRIPEMIVEEAGLVQELHVLDVKRFDAKTYRVTVEGRVGPLRYEAVVPTFLLEEAQ